MDKVKIPDIDQLTSEQRAVLVAQLEAKMGGEDEASPTLVVPKKPLKVTSTPVVEVIEAAKVLPEGSVPAQILSPETHPHALSMQEQLADMLNGEISGTEAQEAMNKLMGASNN